MKKELINIEKIFPFYKTDYGIKSFCNNYLVKDRGYNTRHQLRFIKQNDFDSIVSQIVEKGETRALLADETGSKKIKSEIRDNIYFKVYNSSYQGDRHERNLPVRGQRSKTNARNSKTRNFKIQVALDVVSDEFFDLSKQRNDNKS